MQTGFEHSFPFTRLSRARAKDKTWITTALRKVVKSNPNCIRNVYKAKQEYETKYMYNQYRRTFQKVALKPEEMY